MASIRTSQKPYERDSLARFSHIINNSFCSFAYSAKLAGSSNWVGDSRNLTGNLNNYFLDLMDFVGEPDNLRSDGYVIELASPIYGKSLSSLCVSLRKTLIYLSDRDPAEVHAMRKSVGIPYWTFSFAACRFFVSAFAPCYEAVHPRCTSGLSSTFFLFLPESTFVKEVPEGHSVLPQEVRLRIRSSYSANGRCYDGSISESNIEAYRFIKPLKLGDPSVAWWDAAQFPDDMLDAE